MVNPDVISGMFLFMTNDNYYHCDTVYGNLEFILSLNYIVKITPRLYSFLFGSESIVL